MTIKKTKEKGFSIVGKTAEIILGADNIKIIRKQTLAASLPGTRAGGSGAYRDYIISSPGEYEIEQISIFANEPYPSFLITLEGFNLAYLPNPPQKTTPADFTAYEQIDILIIPGNRYDVINQLAPALIIPLNNTSALSEKMGIGIPETKNSLTIKKTSSLPEETTLINLG